MPYLCKTIEKESETAINQFNWKMENDILSLDQALTTPNSLFNLLVKQREEKPAVGDRFSAYAKLLEAATLYG